MPDDLSYLDDEVEKRIFERAASSKSGGGIAAVSETALTEEDINKIKSLQTVSKLFRKVKVEEK